MTFEDEDERQARLNADPAAVPSVKRKAFRLGPIAGCLPVPIVVIVGLPLSLLLLH